MPSAAAGMATAQQLAANATRTDLSERCVHSTLKIQCKLCSPGNTTHPIAIDSDTEDEGGHTASERGPRRQSLAIEGVPGRVEVEDDLQEMEQELAAAPASASAAVTPASAFGTTDALAETQHETFCPERHHLRLLRNGAVSANDASSYLPSLLVAGALGGSCEGVRQGVRQSQSRGRGGEEGEGMRERARTKVDGVGGSVTDRDVRMADAVDEGGGEGSGSGAIDADAECKPCRASAVDDDDDIFKATHRCTICGPMCEVRTPLSILNNLVSFLEESV